MDEKILFSGFIMASFFVNVKAQCIPVNPPVPDSVTLSPVYQVCGLDIDYFPTATDECGNKIIGALQILYTNGDTTKICWTYKDNNGNTTTQNQYVIFTYDYEDAPHIGCPENKTVFISEEEMYYTVRGWEFLPSYYYDLCGIVKIENNINHSDSIEGEKFPLGYHSIKWIATNVGGNTNECSYILTVEIGTGIENNLEKEIKVYPNPSRGIINIDIDDFEKVEIFRPDGIHIDTKQNNIIDVSSYSEGVYWLIITTRYGKIHEKKVVILK